MAKEKFFILDGSSLLYRAFYALPLLESDTGVYTNAIVGFSNMLVKLLTDWQPAALAIAFDKGKHTFRTDMYADYKGTRKPMPQELRSQVPMLHELAEAWGIPFLELEGYEADDIIGTLANKAVDKGMEAYVVTGDRDALQLVKPNLKVLFTKKGISELIVYDEEQFRQDYDGLDPIQLIDMKGLMGDTSDNIPGVPKVGPKTAIKLLAAYGSVEQVLLHIEEISGKALKERLRDNQQQAVLSKKLATIKLDVPVEYDGDKFALSLHSNVIKDFYQKYNMRSIQRQVDKVINLLAGEEPAAAEPEPQPRLEIPAVNLVKDIKAAQELVKKAKKAKKISLVGNFAGKVPHKKLLAVAMEIAGELYYAKMAVESQEAMGSLFAEEEPAEEASPMRQVLEEILLDAKVEKYIYGLKNFYHCGFAIKGNIYDVELLGYLANSSINKYALTDLAYRYVESMPELTEEMTDEQQLGWQAFAVARLGEILPEKIEKLGMTKLYQDMELPLVEVLAAMEQTGMVLNPEKLARQTAQAEEIIQGLEKEIYTMAGREFNISSPKQLGVVLFEELGLPIIKKTKTGYATNVEVLNELYNLHPIIEKILAYRQWTKLKGTYLDGMAPLIDRETGRIHTSFNQTVTATGRLSSSEPNLQNIPVRSQEGRHIREMFEPGAGYDMILSADYSQIELRVLADMSQDGSFVKAFCSNEDIHARTAAEVFGVALSQVTPELRRKAKAVNFGIVYGMSDFGLAQDLHISRKEAREYIDKYFEKCSGVKAFIDQVVADAHSHGYVLTKYGRRRDLPGIRSSNYNQRSLAERMAMNTPIQGTAADIIKLAMIRTYKALQVAGLKSRILLQVHDELVLEVAETELQQVEAILHESMEQAAQLLVPLTIDINTGKNWAEAK